MQHGEWKTQPSYVKNWNLDAKLLMGKARVNKTNDFSFRHNCLYFEADNVLLGVVLQQDDLHYYILLRPGASIQLKWLSDFVVESCDTTTVMRFKKKRKFVPDPDSEC